MSLRKNLSQFARLVASATTIVIFFILFKPKIAKASDLEDLTWLNRIAISPPRLRDRWAQETPGMEQGRRVAAVKREQRRQRQDEALAEQCVEELIVRERRLRTRIMKYSVDERWRGEGLNHRQHVLQEMIKARQMVSRIHPRLLEPYPPLFAQMDFETQHQVTLDTIKNWTSQSRDSEIMVFGDDVGDPIRPNLLGYTMRDMGESGTSSRGPEPTREERFAGTIFVDEEERVHFLRDKIEREPSNYRLPDLLVYATARDLDSQRQLARSIKSIQQIVEQGADGEPDLIVLATTRFAQAQTCRISSYRAKRSHEILFMALPVCTNMQQRVQISYTDYGMPMTGSSPVGMEAYRRDLEANADQKYYYTLRNKAHEAIADAHLNDLPGFQIIW
jgi:hypothetical protein